MGGRGDHTEGSGTCCQGPPSRPSPSATADRGDGGSQGHGFFPGKGTQTQVAVVRPWGQGDHRPLLHQPAGGRDSAGLCPWRRRGCGGKIQVVPLCCGLPQVGGTRGHPQSTAQSLRGHNLVWRRPRGRAGRAAGAAALRTPRPPQEDTGRGGPRGSGLRAAGQWLGWWQQEPRQAGPPSRGLGQAGATGNHNNYKIKPFPLGGKTNNKNPTK